jgi:hypothetical protein
MKNWKETIPHHSGAFIIGMLILALVLVIVSRNAVSFTGLRTPSLSDPVVEEIDSARLTEIREPSSESFLYPLDLVPPDQQRESLSYGDVVAMYGAQRIQFDSGCRATPAQSIFPLDSTIIFDNRSENLQGVAFDGETYAVPPYHVRVIKLTRQGIFQVDCGQSKNVAKITVQ